MSGSLLPLLLLLLLLMVMVMRMTLATMLRGVRLSGRPANIIIERANGTLIVLFAEELKRPDGARPIPIRFCIKTTRAHARTGAPHADIESGTNRRSPF